jgi:hypothetical protein
MITSGPVTAFSFHVRVPFYQSRTRNPSSELGAQCKAIGIPTQPDSQFWSRLRRIIHPIGKQSTRSPSGQLIAIIVRGNPPSRTPRSSRLLLPVRYPCAIGTSFHAHPPLAGFPSATHPRTRVPRSRSAKCRLSRGPRNFGGGYERDLRLNGEITRPSRPPAPNSSVVSIKNCRTNGARLAPKCQPHQNARK